MSEPTTLMVFRILNGQRVPFIVELDEEMTVVSDRPADGTPISTKGTPLAALEAYPDLDNPFFSAGIKEVRELPGGGKQVVLKPTQLDIKVGMWVTPNITDNPIPGTDDLRAEFFEAEKAMRDAHAEQGTQCSDCDLGALIRRYRLKLFNDGFLDPYLEGSSVTN